MNRIKVIFFDLDNTLVDSDRAYEKGLNAIGLSSKNPAFSEARTRVKKLLGPHHPSSRNRILYFKEMLEAHEKFSSTELLQLMTKYETVVVEDIRRQWQDLKRDPLFEKLAERYSLGIITNETTRTQMLKLSAIDPNGKYFEKTITSEEVGVEKPDQKIYRHALDLFHSSPNECLWVGDDWENDIEPGLELGFNTVWSKEFFKGNPPANPRTKIKVLEALGEIETIL